VDGRAGLASATLRPHQWDGVMITTILEVLVAVVVLIVIIAVAALHFLRADDSDTFDDMPEEPRKTRRHPAEAHPLDDAGPAERRVRRPDPARDQRAADDRRGRQPGYPERRSNPGPGSQRPVPVGARQAKAARPADAEPANGWDSLSDVDYWAEVASEKPISPAEAQGVPNPAKRSRRGIEPKADAPRPAARDDSGQLPLRQRSQSRPGTGPSRPVPAPSRPGAGASRPATGPYGAEPATQNLAALARLGDQPPSVQRPGRPTQRPQAPGPRPGGASRGTGQRALPPAPPQAPAAQAHSGGHSRPPLRSDDDPLTSPSFPAINASDSRSYRTRSRSTSQPSSSPAAGGRGNGSYGDPARQLPAYPGQTSTPDGYPVPATAARHGAGHSPAPAANPYGSYVSPAQPSYAEPAGGHLDPSSYGNGYAAGQQAVAAANWYGGSTDANQAANGYLPAPRHGNGAPDAYSPSDYGAGYQTPGYEGGQPGYSQHGLPGQYDQPGYNSSDVSYGQDGYEAHPGYGGAAR
jgi:hypothetical protein